MPPEEHPPSTILIVEDDEPTQRLLAAVLRRMNLSGDVAPNGARAIELLGTNDYAAVILDVMMPEVGGKAVVEHIAASPRKVPVIVCSAAGASALAGFDPTIVKAIIRKPFDVNQLIEAISGVASGSRELTRILVVDDDERSRFAMKSILDTAEVLEAASGDEALAMIASSRPDVVLLDMILPGMSGEEVLAKIAGDATRRIPVILVASHVLSAEEEVSLLRNAAAVIYKGDLSRITLTRAVEDALSRAR